MNKEEFQEHVTTSYPPTNIFKVDTLEPVGVLKERWEIIKQFSEFWKGKRLLDIGCNNLWFSVYNHKKFEEIEAIDPSHTGEIAFNSFEDRINNIKYQKKRFGEYWSSKKFDRILVLNGPHHLFKDCGNSWRCIDKLAALSSGLVLTEGAKGLSCQDFKDFNEEFNFFEKCMLKYFDKISETPSPSYTPDRYVILWRKKTNPFIEGLRSDCRVFYKKYKKDFYTDSNEVSVELCSNNSRYNTSVQAHDKEGWTETRIEPDSHIFRYFEGEKLSLLAHCSHNIKLAMNGYWDFDPATINYYVHNTDWGQQIKYFDKSGTMPIELIEEKHIKCYFILFKQSYSIVPSVELDILKFKLENLINDPKWADKKDKRMVQIFSHFKGVINEL